MAVWWEGELRGRGQNLPLKETDPQLSQGPARAILVFFRHGLPSIYLVIPRSRNGRVPLQDSLSKNCGSFMVP